MSCASKYSVSCAAKTVAGSSFAAAALGAPRRAGRVGRTGAALAAYEYPGASWTAPRGEFERARRAPAFAFAFALAAGAAAALGRRAGNGGLRRAYSLWYAWDCRPYSSAEKKEQTKELERQQENWQTKEMKK